MRIVFLGTPDLAIPALEALARNHRIAAVVCRPDKEQGRGRKPGPPAVKRWALEHSLPVHQPEKLNDGSFEQWLRETNPELCVMAAYGRILKQPILDVPPRGFLNLHPSLLPRYRGASPIQTALLNGDKTTGVTIMKVTLEMDAGPILLQEETPILPEDTAVTLSERLAKQGADLLVKGIDLLETGRAVFVPQDDALATYCKRFEKEDGRIDWRRSAEEIHNLVRAALPWPVAHSPFEGEMMRILRSEPRPVEHHAPLGSIIAVEKDAIVTAAGRGALAILELQMPGKRAMTTAEFLRGRRVKTGQRFEGT